MRHRILVVAHDVMLRSTLARWLMSAGYRVELAEGEKRAREVFAHHQIALTILARGQSGTLALELDGSCGTRLFVTEPSQASARPGHSTHPAAGVALQSTKATVWFLAPPTSGT